MKINKENFSYMSNLVKLDFTKEEEIKLTKDLSETFGFIKKMNALNTDKVEPMTHVHMMKNIYREDVAVDSKTEENLLLDAADSQEGSFVVRRFL